MVYKAPLSKDTHPTLHPIKEKLKAFGWSADYCNGHNVKKY